MCNGAGFEHSARLVARMASALGADIEASVQSGEMLPEEYDLRVFDCLGCGNPKGCEAWLERQEAAEKVAPAAPGYCRNKDVLEELARR